MLRSLPLAAALLAAPAAAEVVQATPAGFEVRQTITVAVPPARAWPTVVAPRLWWNKDHTYSDDPANLTLDERPGGCFCERLPNKGGVEHMRVVYIQPPLAIRMVGALGPLQAEAAEGTLALTLKAEGGGTLVTLTYVAGGYVRGGADKLAGNVDRVLGIQLAGLKVALDGTTPAAADTPAAAPPADQVPLGDVGETISRLGTEAAEPPAATTPPKPRPADQDTPR